MSFPKRGPNIRETGGTGHRDAHGSLRGAAESFQITAVPGGQSLARNRVPRGNLTDGVRNSKSAARTARPAGGGAPWARWPRCTTADQGQLILPMNTSTDQLRVQLDVRTGVQVARRGAGAVSPVDLCGYLSRPHPSRGQLHPTAAYAAEPGATRRNSQSIASNDKLDVVEEKLGGCEEDLDVCPEYYG